MNQKPYSWVKQKCLTTYRLAESDIKRRAAVLVISASVHTRPGFASVPGLFAPPAELSTPFGSLGLEHAGLRPCMPTHQWLFGDRPCRNDDGALITSQQAPRCEPTGGRPSTVVVSTTCMVQGGFHLHAASTSCRRLPLSVVLLQKRHRALGRQNQGWARDLDLGLSC